MLTFIKKHGTPNNTLLIILLLLLMFRISFAGACMCTTKEYLDMLTTAEVDDTSSMSNETLEALYCIHHWTDYLVMGYEYFAAPGALDKIEKMTQLYRERVYQLVPKFLESEGQLMWEFAACALAYYKWSGSFEYLMKCERTSISKKCVLFAILGDKRAIPIIIQYYWELEKTYKTKPQFGYPDKMNCLNALYHLASPEILPFTDSVIVNPRPPEILKRAEKVKKRILELYPDVGNDLSTGDFIDLDSVLGVRLTEEDKAEIYRKTLEWAVDDQNIPDYNLISYDWMKDVKQIILSSANIEPWLIPTTKMKLLCLDPNRIQSLADKYGDFLYLSFDKLIVENSDVIVRLRNTWAIKQGRVVLIQSGGFAEIKFYKESGKWKKKAISVLIK